MEVLKAFAFNEIDHIVQTITTESCVLFKASDIAKVLGITNIRTSIENFDYTEKTLHAINTPGGVQNTIFLTETGIYRVLFQSRKPIAVPFQRWVAGVIKEIREKGSYNLAQANAAIEKAKLDHQILLNNIAAQMREKELTSSHISALNACKPRDALFYIGFIRDMTDGLMMIKIGSTLDLRTRAPQLIKEFGTMYIMHVFYVDMHIQFERFLQRHNKIKNMVFTDPINGSHGSNG